MECRVAVERKSEAERTASREEFGASVDVITSSVGSQPIVADQPEPVNQIVPCFICYDPRGGAYVLGGTEELSTGIRTPFYLGRRRSRHRQEPGLAPMQVLGGRRRR